MSLVVFNYKTIHPLRCIFLSCEAENGARQKDRERVLMTSKKDVFRRYWKGVGKRDPEGIFIVLMKVKDIT